MSRSRSPSFSPHGWTCGSDERTTSSDAGADPELRLLDKSLKVNCPPAAILPCMALYPYSTHAPSKYTSVLYSWDLIFQKCLPFKAVPPSILNILHSSFKEHFQDSKVWFGSQVCIPFSYAVHVHSDLVSSEEFHDFPCSRSPFTSNNFNHSSCFHYIYFYWVFSHYSAYLG